MSDEQKVDQAEKLQQLFSEINDPKLEEKKASKQETEFIEIDVLNLPPRSEIHKNTMIRYKINLRRPLWRFLFVLICLFVIIGVVYYMYGEQIILFFT